MRRFVALPVPSDVRRSLEAAVAPVRDTSDDRLTWSRPEGWHVTLAFLGNVPDDAVTSVVEVVGATLGRVTIPARLRLSGAGRFGRGVLWAGVADEPGGSIAAMGEAVQQALEDAGLPVQRQAVEPHVTLARSRRRVVTDQVVRTLDVPERSWEVTAVELWRSRLGGGPARYDVDASLAVG